MSTVRFFTDEDVYGAIAVALRRSGFDAVSTPETGRLGESDESQLQWAASESRVIMTFNVAHFFRLHTEWIRQGRHHAGIVVSSQRPIGEVLDRLHRFAHEVDDDTMRDRLEFLSDW